MPDVIGVIKAQHRLIDGLLEKAAEGGDEAGDAVQQVYDLLLPHSNAEEDFVYPTIKAKASEAGDEVADGVAEHHQIEGMLEQLLEQQPGDPGYDGLLAAVTAELRHHVEEEEQDLLPVLEDKSSADELQRMGERFLAATGGAGADAAESGGGDATREELYERAQEQDVPGRSSMTKDELAEAVED